MEKVMQDTSKIDTSKKIYTCSVCSNLFNWQDGSCWFGSLKDQEDGKPLIYCCTNDCRKVQEEKTPIPKRKEK